MSMKNALSHNAFNVLGLTSNASYKDVTRKAREIIRNSEIGDSKVDGDFNLFAIERDPSVIEESLSSLSTPKKKLQEYFFWFDSSDKEDEEAVNLIRLNNTERARLLWKSKSKGSGIDNLFKKKNLTILLTCLVLGGKKEYLLESLDLWRELFSTAKFWTSFQKVYKMNNDEEIDSEILENFKAEAEKCLSDIYLDASDADKSIFAEFQSVFSIKGRAIKSQVVDPALNKLNITIDNLEKLEPSADGVFTGDEAREVSSAIRAIKDQLDKLLDYGLYNESETKIARDRAASAIRMIMLDIHNKLDETEKGLGLLKIALAIVATGSVKKLIEDDIKTLSNVLRQQDIVSPIFRLMEEEKYTEAMSLINQTIKKHEKDKVLCEFLKGESKRALAMIMATLSKEGWDALNGKKLTLAETKFKEIAEAVQRYKYLTIFDFNEEGLKEYLANVEVRASLTSIEPSLLDNIIEDVKKDAQEKFSNPWDGLALITLVNSRIMPKFIYYVRRIKIINTLNTIGWITVWIYGIGIIFWIAGWIYKKTRSA